jgi:(p)ppGpp synthase/HD superfamily hydrolase
MNPLESAITLAVTKHQGQKDKAGKPYILHPLRLMLQMDSEAEMMAAVLHDVVEDCRVELDELAQEGIPPKVVEAVACLTRKEGEAYDQFIARAAQNPIAFKVKRADLLDNMNLTRLDQLSSKDLERVEKYHQALKQLNA